MKYGAEKIPLLLPTLPAVNLMPNRMSGYESDAISVRIDFAAQICHSPLLPKRPTSSFYIFMSEF